MLLHDCYCMGISENYIFSTQSTTITAEDHHPKMIRLNSCNSSGHPDRSNQCSFTPSRLGDRRVCPGSSKRQLFPLIPLQFDKPISCYKRQKDTKSMLAVVDQRKQSHAINQSPRIHSKQNPALEKIPFCSGYTPSD